MGGIHSMADSNRYDAQNIATMEMIYGEGYLSAGGDSEVAAILEGVPLSGARVLDLGCGLGGASITIVRDHHAAHVHGVDIDGKVLDRAAELVDREGLGERITLQQIEPGPLPFANDRRPNSDLGSTNGILENCEECETSYY